MTDENKTKKEPRMCWLLHSWNKWEQHEVKFFEVHGSTLITDARNEPIIGHKVRQQRECKVCGLTQRKEL